MSASKLFNFILFSLISLPAISFSQANQFRETLRHTEEISHEFPDSAFKLLKDLYPKVQKAEDIMSAGICLQQMGEVCFKLGHYAQSFDFYNQADQIFRKQNNKLLLARNLNGVGLVYYYNQQKQRAREQYNQALIIFSRLNNQEGLAQTYSRLGHLYEKEKKPDSAFVFQRMALAYISKTNRTNEIAKIYENIGSIHEDLARYDSAEYYFTKSLALYKQVNNQQACIEVINNLGDILRKTGKPAAALLKSREALKLSISKNDLYGKTSALRDISKAFNLLNRNDSAYYYLELSRDVSNVLYSTEGTRQTAFLQVLYDFEKKNREIKDLENISHTNSVITAATIIIIALLVILGWVIIGRQRLKLKDQKSLSEHKDRLYENEKKLMEIALENQRLQEENLTQLLNSKSAELSNHILNLVQKNQVLEELKNKLMNIIKDDKRDHKKHLQQIIHQINHSFSQEQYWKSFTGIFEQVHQSFFDNLKKHSEDLTANDIRLLSLLKLNLPPKDTATLLGISPESLRVSRYRLKKKLNIPENESLTSFIHSLKTV
ncbi:tetratricopeptide repeat protein [Desertivirga arenae]|uniref:tetratricopeptide repeat protein n=1 Tax=Desertivirga arenae TaxID=2810309 RepID=UPI001A966785|nr:tetratricopeptide repeat protein [Pedobacter sp. SYSU D00823]